LRPPRNSCVRGRLSGGFADAQYSNPNSRIFPAKDEFHGSWDVGAMLSWTVSDIPGAAASTKGATADVVTLTAQRHALEDSIRLEVTDSYEKTVEADAAVGPAEERVVAAEEAYRVRHELFKNGRATSVELTDAETELLRARTDALNTHVNQRVARVRLAYAVGS
jgi:outer membrane protein TolC